MRDIAEADWKTFKRLHPLALNRFSKETLSKINQIIISKEIETKHEKYLEIYTFIKKRNKLLCDVFNEYRRSTAKLSILQIHNLGMFKPGEFNQFSDDVKDFVKKCNEL